MNMKICIDCGQLHKKGLRCVKCSTKFSDKKKKHCVSCGKEIGRRKETSKCRSCARKETKGTYEWCQKAKERRMAENNPAWKEDNVGKNALHKWLKKRLIKPKFCQKCGQSCSSLDLANKSGQYKRDLSDWEWLCRRCHMENDGRLAKLIEKNKERKKIITNCPHTDRKNYGNKMCKNCFQQKWRKENPEKMEIYRKLKNASINNDEILGGDNMGRPGRPLFVYCPECGLRFDRRNAFATLEKFGERLYFCSEKCVNKRWKKNAHD